MSASSMKALHTLALVEYSLSDLVLAEEICEHRPEETEAQQLKEYLEYRNAFLSDCLPDPGRIEALRAKNAARKNELENAEALLRLSDEMLEKLEARYETTEEALSSDRVLTDRFIEALAEKGRMEPGIVSELLCCLPVRVTKSRFYYVISERLSVYKNGDEDAFLEKIAAVRETAFPEAHDASEDLLIRSKKLLQAFREKKEAEYGTDEICTLRQEADALGQALKTAGTFPDLLQSALNWLLLLVLASRDGGSCLTDDTALPAQLLLKHDQTLFSADNETYETLLDEAYRLSGALEGLQEDALDAFNRESAALENKSGRDKDGRVSGNSPAALYRIAGRILSGGSYAPLEKLSGEEVPAERPLDNAVFTQETERLIADLSALFRESSRFYTRSVMAALFRLLPPLVHTQEEVENYFLGMLAACGDETEKRVSVRRIFRMIRELR